jgi:hypothetical protein
MTLNPTGQVIDFVAADPYSEDLTIALHTLYELHYGGFDGVDAAGTVAPAVVARPS